MKIKLIILFALFPWFIFSQNYDESKVGNFILPDVLTTESGQKISTNEEWETIRRPEILRLFENHVYGIVPKDFDKISFKTLETNKKSLNGQATYRKVAINVSRNGQTATIYLNLFTPNKGKKRPPVFLVINHRGAKTMDISRVTKTEFWPAEEVIDAGYALAGFDVIDVAPDNNTTFTEKILDNLYPEQKTLSNGMRALGAWGWGASRIIDYFEKSKVVDSSRIIVVGHSRSGKAALWCGAQDKRVAVAISNESGNSGAKISRRNFGESVEAITKSFPYWFVPGYKQYANNESSLPIDQHMLLALMAPRAVYIASAADDLWADPKGQYLALTEAQPVFNFYNFGLQLPKNMPANNAQIIQIPVGFHNRDGNHDMTLVDWKKFIQYANVYFHHK